MLAADQALYGGAHLGLLWGAFARRGLGASASQGSSNVLTDNEEAFDLPLPAGSATVGPSTVTASASAAAASTVPTATVTVANTGGSGDLHFQARIAYTTAVGGDAPPAEPGRPAEDGEYTWTSSDAPGGPPFAFHDISATGSPITFFQGGYTEAPLPFPFPFYGRTYDRAFLTSKGFLTFLPPTGLPTPTGIPNPTPPNALIAPFWTSGSITEVYTGVLPDGRFAVQFESSARRFEVLLSPGGVIEFQYDVIGPAIPTYSGIEDEGGVRGLATVRPDHDRTAIRIRPPEGWLTVDPAEGTVPPGGSVPLTLSFDPTDLTAGTHAARLLVSTNEADRPTHAVDVRLTVAPAAEFTGRAGWRLLAAPVTGMTVGDLAAQNLVQGTPGLYPGAAPNLLTAYDGTAWRAPTGPGAALPPGRGFAWYLFDDDRDPGGPSRSVPLPARLATPADAATPAGPVAIPLHAAGDGLNVVGNPFDAALDASGLTSWAAGGSLASGVGQVWDPSMSSFRLTTEPGVMVAPWQGFVVENGSATALTVPAPAPTTPPAPANTRRLVFVVEGSTPEGIAVADRATILQFGPGGAQGWDAGDATELRPLASTYVSLSFEGARDGRAVLKAQESRPEALAPLSIPLGFAAAGTTGVFTLRLMVPASEALPAGWRLELEDLVTGSRTDLRYTSFYQFSGTAQPAGPEPDLAHGLALAAAPRRFMLNLLAPAVPPVAAPLPLDDHRLTLTLEGATPDGTPVLDLPLVLGLHPEASAEWDAWDGLRPLPTAPYAALAFRGLHGGQMVLKVQESQPFPADTTVAAPSFEVPLAFEAANTDSVFVLRWSTPAGFPANWALALEDVETGARTDLRQTDHYAFTAPSREAPDVPLLHAYVRFVLRVTPQAPPTPPPTTVFALHAPAPNPAGTATTIRYETAAEGPVRVEVLDVLGRCIAVLADGREEAGLYTAVLDAGRLASGAYVVRMRAGTFVQTRRLTVAR